MSKNLYQTWTTGGSYAIAQDSYMVKERWLKSELSNPWETIANGIYAVSADGNPVAAEEATTDCIAVALITDNQRIMIPKNDVSDGTNGTFFWSLYLKGKDVSGLANKSDLASAKLDYNGKDNTEKIIAGYTEYGVDVYDRDMYKMLQSYNEGGYTDWYIPACGQICEMSVYRNELKTVLIKIGGTALNTSTPYWSSSEYDPNKAWRVLIFSDGGVADMGKTNDILLRFVRNI